MSKGINTGDSGGGADVSSHDSQNGQIAEAMRRIRRDMADQFQILEIHGFISLSPDPLDKKAKPEVCLLVSTNTGSIPSGQTNQCARALEMVLKEAASIHPELASAKVIADQRRITIESTEPLVSTPTGGITKVEVLFSKGFPTGSKTIQDLNYKPDEESIISLEWHTGSDVGAQEVNPNNMI